MDSMCPCVDWAESYVPIRVYDSVLCYGFHFFVVLLFNERNGHTVGFEEGMEWLGVWNWSNEARFVCFEESDMFAFDDVGLTSAVCLRCL